MAVVKAFEPKKQIQAKAKQVARKIDGGGPYSKKSEKERAKRLAKGTGPYGKKAVKDAAKRQAKLARQQPTGFWI